ncbi:MAG: tetratricopeptide repeat protein, partial [Thermomicrobiales bacterium]|nr:tetratricopeptide repeat protein [Thermomicrobiales bacterium]
MELVELIRGAQDAMDRGDYAFAAAACTHALATYPSCFTAHRMLAEADLEQGRIDAAIGHFERTLTIDPLNVLARLGLGVAAEEKREMSDAYAAYLHAWEINPALDQVRDELVRLRGLLGGDERLHPTRAGLAGIFARGGQFGRAAAEWRAVLMVEPENRRARTALAEILWRSGDDAMATAMCRDALTEFPENARALAMLAEIEQRRGSAASAELIGRYQAVDPLAEIASLLAEWRDGADVSFLRCESASLPDFDPGSAIVDMPVAAAVAAPASTPSGLAGGHFAAPDLWDTLVKDFSSDPQAVGDSATPDDVQPFSWMDEGGAATAPAAEPFTLESLMEPQPVDADDFPMSFMQSRTGPSTDQLSLEDEIAAFDAPAAAPPPPEPPVAPAVQAAPSPIPPASDPFVTPDGRVDLTVGWDDLDRQLKEATPSFDNAAEMDALAAQLGVAGIAPFEIGASTFDEAAWAPFTADDLSEPAAEDVAASEPFVPPAVSVAAEPILQIEDDEPYDLGWDLDEELVSAIPPPQASGYTEMLRHVDVETPPEVNTGADVDPFANPDSSGTPLAFEELLAVTSSDGTSPLGEAEPDVVLADDGYDDLAGLEELAAAFSASVEDEPTPIVERAHVLDDLIGSRGEPYWAESSTASASAGLDWAASDEEPALGEGDDFGFDAALAGLGDLQPFSLEDAAGHA